MVVLQSIVDSTSSNRGHPHNPSATALSATRCAGRVVCGTHPLQIREFRGCSHGRGLDLGTVLSTIGYLISSTDLSCSTSSLNKQGLNSAGLKLKILTLVLGTAMMKEGGNYSRRSLVPNQPTARLRIVLNVRLRFVRPPRHRARREAQRGLDVPRTKFALRWRKS